MLLLKLVIVLLMTYHQRQLAAAYGPYDDDDDDDDIEGDFYKNDGAEMLTRVLGLTLEEFLPRVRRFPNDTQRSSLSPEEVDDVKGALQEMLSGRQLDELLKTYTIPETTAYKSRETVNPSNKPTRNANVGFAYAASDKSDATETDDYDDTTAMTTIGDAVETEDTGISTQDQPSHLIYDIAHAVTRTPDAERTMQTTKAHTSATPTLSRIKHYSNVKSVQRMHIGRQGDTTTKDTEITYERTTDQTVTTRETTTARDQTVTSFEEGTTSTTSTTSVTVTNTTTKTTSKTRRTRTKTKRSRKSRTTTMSTTSPPLLDIPALLAIISNITYDLNNNITGLVNETLQRWSIPTCPPEQTTSTTTAVTTTTTGFDYEGNMTGTIMGKCFVCGLEVEEIPRNAHCADAFAGDFLPLVPVDPTARGQIAMYRKYCRYMDVPRYHYNETDPRSLWGRWTGGCSVRWIDLSGVYTQRSCRNRNKAVMGRHFVSKRMAKLEMALQHVDNGCIISPMSTLVPLSRGISLYARFHACVCTGNWCNRAAPKRKWSTFLVLLSLVVAVYQVT